MLHHIERERGLRDEEAVIGVLVQKSALSGVTDGRSGENLTTTTTTTKGRQIGSRERRERRKYSHLRNNLWTNKVVKGSLQTGSWTEGNNVQMRNKRRSSNENKLSLSKRDESCYEVSFEGDILNYSPREFRLLSWTQQ